MNQGWVLIEPATGLHVGWYFWLRVLDEVNRAARYGAPFGLLLLDATSTDGRRGVDEAIAGVAGAIRATDLAGAVGPGRAAVLLVMQEPEAAVLGQRRVLERLAAATPRGVAWDARLLCYPRDGAEISNLLTERPETASPEICRPA